MSYVTSLTAIFLALVALEDAPNLLKPTNKVDSWRFEQHDGGKGEIKVDGDAIKFSVTASDGTDWHVQAIQTDLDLKEGKEYTVKFKAKASDDRSVGVHAGIDQEDWHQIGLGDSAYLTKEFKEQSFTFSASNVVAKKNRIAIVIGLDKGDVWIKDMTLTEKK